jgi:hypothetical protein
MSKEGVVKYEGIKGSTKADEQEYSYDICDRLQQDGPCKDSVMCQRTPQGATKSCGKGVPKPGNHEGSAALTFENGTVGCGGHARQTKVVLKCGTSESVSIHEPALCTYTLSITSPKLCATKIQMPHTACGFELKSGEWIDLGAVGLAQGKIDDSDYYVDLCGIKNVEGCDGSTVCQRAPSGPVVLAKSSSTSYTPETSPIKGVQFNIGGGSQGCGATERSTLIYANCDPAAIIAKVHVAREAEPCNYRVTISSKHLCTTSLEGDVNPSFNGALKCAIVERYSHTPCEGRFSCDAVAMVVHASNGCRGKFQCGSKLVECAGAFGHTSSCSCK